MLQFQWILLAILAGLAAALLIIRPNSQYGKHLVNQLNAEKELYDQIYQQANE